MRTRTMFAISLAAAIGLVGCYPRAGHHGPWGPHWGNGGWGGNWNGDGWGDRDGDDDGWHGGDWDDDDDHWTGNCHPANNFCGNKPWW